MSIPSESNHLLHQLTPAQLLALDALDSGATQRQAAELADVDRTTVGRWSSKHPEFIAELNRRKIDRSRAMETLVGETTQLAIEQVRMAIESGDPALAIQWLKLCELETRRPTCGPTTSSEVVEQHRLQMPNKHESANAHLLGEPTTKEAAENLREMLAER